MKMTKKILLATVACAAVMFTGCLKELGNDFIKYSEATSAKDKGNATASISYTNSKTDEFARGMKFLRTAHKGITAKINIKDQTYTSHDGVMGIVFGKTENDDGTVNFGLVGVQKKGTADGSTSNNGNLRYYVSYYKNVNTADFDADNFGVKTGSTATETVIKGFTNLKTGVVKASDEAKVVSICVKVASNSDLTGYDITFYNEDDMDSTGKIKNSATSLISAVSVPMTFAKSDTKKTDKPCGFYANVYASKTLNGTWNLYDTEGNPIAIEWDDTYEACPLFD